MPRKTTMRTTPHQIGNVKTYIYICNTNGCYLIPILCPKSVQTELVSFKLNIRHNAPHAAKQFILIPKSLHPIIRIYAKKKEFLVKNLHM